MKTAVEVQSLSVVLKGNTVLEDVNFTLEEGGILGVIGPNGAGKSILLKTLVGLVKPTSGSVRIFGEPISRVHRDIGYVPQFARFDLDFPTRVIDVVLMGCLGPRSFGRRYARSEVSSALHVLDELHMHHMVRVQIGKLSGGQLQRVMIARALVGKPRLLLLDEPTASLDTSVGVNFYDLLRELSRRMTIILVSHDVGVLAEYVTSVGCLNRRLYYHDSKEIDSKALEQVYGCPVELIAHGHAHRVLANHDSGGADDA